MSRYFRGSQTGPLLIVRNYRAAFAVVDLKERETRVAESTIMLDLENRLNLLSADGTHVAAFTVRFEQFALKSH